MTALKTPTTPVPEPDWLPAGVRVFDRAQFLELLRGKRYDEALDALYQMRAAAPENASVSRGIQVLKEKLLADCVARLGSLDAVVLKVDTPNTPPTEDETEVLSLLNGEATLGEVLSRCRVGRLAAARALCGLADRGAVALVEAKRPNATGPEVDAPPPVAVEASPDTEHYEALFHQAMGAYLKRDVDTALSLFAQCLARRPDDKRVLHNMERLRQRQGTR